VTVAQVIRHHVEDDAGLIGEALEARGFVVRTLMVDATHAAPDQVDADLVVVLGSNSSVYDRTVRSAWLEREFDLLRDVDARGVSIFGICFGAQILCELFGGTVERAPAPEMGWKLVDVVPGAPLDPGPWFEYHGDRCLVPADATVWATSELAVQAFTIGRHVAVQFHPEVDDAQLARWFDSQNGDARARSPRQAELLDETRRETAAARARASRLVAAMLEFASARLI
jgi:GMP synthase-like glutamine amidotransferase